MRACPVRLNNRLQSSRCLWLARCLSGEHRPMCGLSEMSLNSPPLGAKEITASALK